MTIELIIPVISTMDSNIERFGRSTMPEYSWLDCIRRLPGVVNATWKYSIDDYTGYTVVNFESEEAKLLFILRWS